MDERAKTGLGLLWSWLIEKPHDKRVREAGGPFKKPETTKCYEDSLSAADCAQLKSDAKVAKREAAHCEDVKRRLKRGKEVSDADIERAEQYAYNPHPTPGHKPYDYRGGKK